MRFSELMKGKYVFDVLRVFTLRHIQYNNPLINHGKEYDPVFKCTQYLNECYFLEYVYCSSKLILFIPLTQTCIAYMKNMNRL